MRGPRGAFAATLVLGLLVAILAPRAPEVLAQRPAGPARLGWLSYIGQPDPGLAILLEGLRERGYVEALARRSAARSRCPARTEGSPSGCIRPPCRPNSSGAGGYRVSYSPNR